MATATQALDYSNHNFSARDRIEKYAEVFTGSHTLNNIYGNVLAKTLRKGYNSEKFNASEVYLNLWVGDVYAAHNTSELKKRGITHIVNCVPGVSPAFPSDFKYLHIPLLDCATESICEKFNQSFDFIHNALSNHGRVLVHCLQGMSRSATIASAYVMKALHVSAQEAVNILQAKRGIVKPNYGFMIQLEIFGKQMDKDINKEHSDVEKAIIASGKPAEVAVQESHRRASVCPEVSKPLQVQNKQQKQESSWKGFRRSSVNPEMLSSHYSSSPDSPQQPANKSSFGASLRARLNNSFEMKKTGRRLSTSTEMSPMKNSGGSTSSPCGSPQLRAQPLLQHQLSSHRRSSICVEMTDMKGGSLDSPRHSSIDSPQLRVQHHHHHGSVDSPQLRVQHLHHHGSVDSPQLRVQHHQPQLQSHRRASVCSEISSGNNQHYSPHLQLKQQQHHHQQQHLQQLSAQQNWRLSSCPEIQDAPQQQHHQQQQGSGRRSSICPEIVISSSYEHN